MPPALAGTFFTASATWEAPNQTIKNQIVKHIETFISEDNIEKSLHNLKVRKFWHKKHISKRKIFKTSIKRVKRQAPN